MLPTAALLQQLPNSLRLHRKIPEIPVRSYGPTEPKLMGRSKICTLRTAPRLALLPLGPAKTSRDKDEPHQSEFYR